MTPAVVSVLTKGLTCGMSEACEGGTTMTAPYFTLWCKNNLARNIRGGGGVAYPNALSGDVARATAPNINVPQSDPDLIYIDPKKVMGRRVPVKMKFKMGDYEVEKIYTVSTSKAEILIKMMNLVNASKHKMSATMTNLKRKTGKLSILYTRGRAFISKRRDFD